MIIKEYVKLRKTELKNEFANIKQPIKFVIIQLNEDAASNAYIKGKLKDANELGVNAILLKFPTSITEEDLLKEIDLLNKDQSVTGFIVQMPLPKQINEEHIKLAIDPKKDVDGLTTTNMIKLIKGQKCLKPCTPKGIVTLLDYYNIDVTNKKVVIVGRSELVGLPLFHLLLYKNATITLCHSKTNDLSYYTKHADILIVSVGKKDLITPDMIKKGVIIIDVGINRVDGSLFGDVSCECQSKAKLITPVPGGVGPMTVISLMENVYEANLN